MTRCQAHLFAFVSATLLPMGSEPATFAYARLHPDQVADVLREPREHDVHLRLVRVGVRAAQQPRQPRAALLGRRPEHGRGDQAVREYDWPVVADRVLRVYETIRAPGETIRVR